MTYVPTLILYISYSVWWSIVEEWVRDEVYSSSPDCNELSSAMLSFLFLLCLCFVFKATVTLLLRVAPTRSASRECDTTPIRRSKAHASALICCNAAFMRTRGDVSWLPESFDSKDSFMSSSFSVTSASSFVSFATPSFVLPDLLSSSSKIFLTWVHDDS